MRQDAVRALNRWLLPPRLQHSWLPYLWLFWLFGFFQKWFVVPIEPVELTLALCTVAVFLPLYFNGYWRTGRRLLGTVAGCLLIGIVWLPFNTGAMPFFGYGSAFVGRAARPRQAFMYLAGIVLLVASESLVLGMPPDFLLFGPCGLPGDRCGDSPFCGGEPAGERAEAVAGRGAPSRDCGRT